MAGDAADGFAPLGAASEGVVFVAGGVACGGAGGDEFVVDVPTEGAAVAVGQEIAIGVVRRRQAAAAPCGVGVDAVGGVVRGGAVGRCGGTVPGGIVVPVLGGGESAVAGAGDLAGVVVAVGLGKAVASDASAASVGAQHVAGGVERAIAQARETARGIVAPTGREDAVLDHGGRDLVACVVGVSSHRRWGIGVNAAQQIA